MFKQDHVLVGCPLSPSYQSDTRVISLLESWNTKDGITTFYPSTLAAECGRQNIVSLANYMKPRPTHILFVDYDVLPRRNTLDKLLAHDKDIVSGVYPTTRKCKISWCLSKEEPFVSMEINDIPKTLFKAKTVCNGIMLVKMEVFDKLEWPYWKNEFSESGLKTGEDIYFCKKARDAGYDLWVDPQLTCNHFKMVDLLGIAKTYIKE